MVKINFHDGKNQFSTVVKINFRGGKNQFFPCDTRKFPCRARVNSHLIGWYSRQNLFWWAAAPGKSLFPMWHAQISEPATCAGLSSHLIGWNSR